VIEINIKSLIFIIQLFIIILLIIGIFIIIYSKIENKNLCLSKCKEINKTCAYYNFRGYACMDIKPLNIDMNLSFKIPIQK